MSVKTLLFKVDLWFMNNKIDTSTAFCQVLRQQRMSRGLTHSTLGLKSGFPRKYIYSLEAGNELPSLRVVLRLANALGYSGAGFVTLIERRMNGEDIPPVSSFTKKLTYRTTYENKSKNIQQ
ncbi:MAG: hypothetical protein CBC01_02705 [Betaproteobacteria bacterium TMED41]|nr:MAG: hypothetical protein CBC01_02705 [Betaproteobacteria bacterium TMED41]|tara:strand:+ start:570 stop:935 length:366 start_codon:yes stop_codon:yes gene_type:complete